MSKLKAPPCLDPPDTGSGLVLYLVGLVVGCGGLAIVLGWPLWLPVLLLLWLTS